MLNFFRKYAILLLISVLICMNTAIAQDDRTNAGMSITDFTIHKIIPAKGTSNTEIKQVQEIPAINEVKGEISAKSENIPPSVAENPVSTNVKKPTKSKRYRSYSTRKATTSKAHNTQKPQNTSVANTIPVAEQQSIVSQKAENPPIIPAGTVREEQSLSEKEYVENLNNLIDGKKVVAEKSAGSSLNSFDYIIKPSMALGVVLLIMLVLAWAYSRISGIAPSSPLFKQFGSVNRFKILATSALGQGKVIQLVEINGKQLVIGSTNNNINLLTEITPEEVEKVKSTEQKTNSAQEKTIEEDPDFLDSEFYSSKYSELYKDYLKKQDNQD